MCRGVDAWQVGGGSRAPLGPRSESGKTVSERVVAAPPTRPPWVPAPHQVRGDHGRHDGSRECRLCEGREVVAAPPHQGRSRTAPTGVVGWCGWVMCGGLEGVATALRLDIQDSCSVPDLRRGRRFGGMPGVGKGRQVGGVAALHAHPGGRPHPSATYGAIGKQAVMWQFGRLLRYPRPAPGSPIESGKTGYGGRGMPDVGKGLQVGGVAALPVCPGGCPQEAPLQVGLASVGVRLCVRFVVVAAPPWVPDLRRGRRFWSMPDVGKG